MIDIWIDVPFLGICLFQIQPTHTGWNILHWIANSNYPRIGQFYWCAGCGDGRPAQLRCALTGKLLIDDIEKTIETSRNKALRNKLAIELCAALATVCEHKLCTQLLRLLKQNFILL